jgi:hypothetical protein
VSCDDSNFCTADADCPVDSGVCPDSTPDNEGLGCTPGSGAPGGVGICTGGVCAVTDPDPVSCDPTVGDLGCEIACNAAANDFGLPTLKVVDPGDLSNSPAEVCFSGAIPLTESFIASANAALGEQFQSAVIRSSAPNANVLVDWGPRMTFGATVGASGTPVELPGPAEGTTYDLTNFPASGFYLVDFSETCGNFDLPASGEQLCFNIRGSTTCSTNGGPPCSPLVIASSGDTPLGSETTFTADAIGLIQTLTATFACGPAVIDALGIDCLVDAECIGADGAAGTGACEQDLPCTTDADCTYNDVQTGTCDTTDTACSPADGCCDTAGSCVAYVFDDPNAGQICFTRP